MRRKEQIRVAVLTDEQRQAYERDGFLLVSGLIPEETGAAAEAAMWRLLSLSPDDRANWPVGGLRHGTFESDELLACYTPEMRAAAAILAGEEGAEFRAPSKPYAINVFPSPGEWTMPHPHIDHAIKEHGHKVFPRAFRVAGMTFLSDVPPHGGGTVVWPGGHAQLRALAEREPETYELMWVLNQSWEQIDLAPPFETTPRRGDVLFYHYLCPHAGSKNVSDRPRLALNMKW
jgi:hypothetical protein